MLSHTWHWPAVSGSLYALTAPLSVPANSALAPLPAQEYQCHASRRCTEIAGAFDNRQMLVKEALAASRTQTHYWAYCSDAEQKAYIC